MLNQLSVLGHRNDYFSFTCEDILKYLIKYRGTRSTCDVICLARYLIRGYKCKRVMWSMVRSSTPNKTIVRTEITIYHI